MTFDQRYHRAEGADSDPGKSMQAEGENVEFWDMNSKERLWPEWDGKWAEIRVSMGPCWTQPCRLLKHPAAAD